MMGENDDLHEILKTLSDELTQVFEKPGITTKYVHAFWQLRIIPDETHEDLLDPAKREGSSVDAGTQTFFCVVQAREVAQ